ncbi:MAG: 30S ribosomal protein S21 [Candidatus Colwellbacteria bacterium]
MAININLKRKDGESNNSLVHRFTKKVMQSGVLKEARSRRYHERNINRSKRRASALHREGKREEVQKAKRMGTFKF